MGCDKSGISVLSLFDGMSCGQIALDRLGVKTSVYFASEIDRYAIKATQFNFPKTIQLGDVCSINSATLPKIDLVIGGSPCQGFSFAGKRLNFEDPRSKLFFEFVRLLNECRAKNPDIIFLLENVVMTREHQMIISKYLGVEPIRINSNLVTAQNRDRLYWTNINTRQINLFGDLQSSISQPNDRFKMLADMLEAYADEKYFVSERVLARADRRNYSRPKILPKKTGTLTAKNNSGQMCLDAGTTLIPVYSKDGTAPRLRRLTIGEAASLQGVTKDYFFNGPQQIVSDTQIYRMLGNGWSVPVIEHILSFAPFAKAIT